MNAMDARDITYYDAMEDLKIMKKLYKKLLRFYYMTKSYIDDCFDD